ncbi:MAG: hypothetical protein KUG81_10005 [Gammaproteobacteria bacterium]|nr:hypothetical protein [Gammaproteobacteria bacterium]
MTNVYLDIETIPAQPEDEAKALIAETISAPATMKKQETVDDWHSGAGKYAGVKEAAIEEAYRKTSLDGAKGQICSIAFAIEDQDVVVDATDSGDDSALLVKFFQSLDLLLDGRPPFFIGHFVAGFDLKFIFHRAVILGIRPPFDLPFSGRHDQHFYDNMQAWAGFGGKISQANLCKALGIEGKPSDITGSNVWTHVKAGDIKRVAEYNVDDVEKARMIYKRLTFNGY